METPLPSTIHSPCCSPKSKLLCLSTGLVALILVAIASFLFGRASVKPSPFSRVLPTPTITLPTPTPGETVYTEDTQTANWKTYINTKHKYSLQFPEEKSFIHNYSSEIDSFTLRYCPGFKEKGEGMCGAPGYDYLAIYTNDNPANKTLDERIKDFYSFKMPECIKNDPQTKITRERFQGFDSIKYEYTLNKQAKEKYCKNEWLGFDEHQETVILRGNKLYILAIVNSSLEAEIELEKIISTFKFLN